MTFVIADRVRETSTTVGTSALTLAGAIAGFQTFSAVCAVGDTLYYALQAVDASGVPTGEWECGLGTYSGANTLTRTTVTSSSNAGAAVNLAAGTRQVYISMPAVQVTRVSRIAIPIAVGDEASNLTTGTNKVRFRMPYAFTVNAVRASVNTAPTGAVLTVDINEGGVSILSTKLTIDATEKTSTTAAIPAVISDAALADDAEISIDIDTVGSTVAGVGLKVYLIGTPL